MGIFNGIKKPDALPAAVLTHEQQRIRDMLNNSFPGQSLASDQPTLDPETKARFENPQLYAEQEKIARRNAVLKRMQEDSDNAEKQVIGITQSWLRLTKGFSSRALADALAHDKDALDLLRVALMLAPAYEPNPESTDASLEP
jgi:hypothetical protein